MYELFFKWETMFSEKKSIQRDKSIVNLVSRFLSMEVTFKGSRELLFVLVRGLGNVYKIIKKAF